ncbi:MAG: response regulator, partial [Planctomycetota bacterium]
MKPKLSRTFRILVVDDESIVLSFVSDALADDDLEITTSSDSKAALELARSTSFDLILSDMRMPGMDG